MNVFSLTGKTALVTGAAQGVGAALSRQLISEGCKVIAVDISEFPEDIATSAHVIQEDVSDKQVWQNIAKQLKQMDTALDVLVNNAAITRDSLVDAVPESAFKCLDINFKSIVYSIDALSSHLKEGASIINVASMVAKIALGGSGIYDASKAAILAYTRSAAIELAPRHIRVNAVLPGIVDTQMGQSFNPLAKTLHPLGRSITADEIAYAIRFLASDAARMISGIELPVDAGLSAGYSLSLSAKF